MKQRYAVRHVANAFEVFLIATNAAIAPFPYIGEASRVLAQRMAYMAASHLNGPR